jgi:hypothetical protein
MSDEEDIAALVIDNGSGMCKGMFIDACGPFGANLSVVLWSKNA